MGHTRSCPHKCEACKSKYSVVFWKAGVCPICKTNPCGPHLGIQGFYACQGCYGNLSGHERTELERAINEVNNNNG